MPFPGDNLISISQGIWGGLLAVSSSHVYLSQPTWDRSSEDSDFQEMWLFIPAVCNLTSLEKNPTHQSASRSPRESTFTGTITRQRGTPFQCAVPTLICCPSTCGTLKSFKKHKVTFLLDTYIMSLWREMLLLSILWYQLDYS